MKLSHPQGYGEIQPLHGNTAKPIRCTDSWLTISAAPSAASCTHCRALCTAGTCSQPAAVDAGHAWYYDLTDEHRFSEDPESLLVWLCEGCAATLEADDLVQFAGSDGLCDVPCWQCGAAVEHTERTGR